MRNDELNRLSNNILLVYDGLVEDESRLSASATYALTDTLSLEINVDKLPGGEVERYAFTVIDNGRPAQGSCGNYPVELAVLKSDLIHTLKCGIPENIVLDLSLCGITQPVKDESTGVYRFPVDGITV